MAVFLEGACCRITEAGAARAPAPATVKASRRSAGVAVEHVAGDTEDDGGEHRVEAPLLPESRLASRNTQETADEAAGDEFPGRPNRPCGQGVIRCCGEPKAPTASSEVPTAVISGMRWRRRGPARSGNPRDPEEAREDRQRRRRPRPSSSVPGRNRQAPRFHPDLATPQHVDADDDHQHREEEEQALAVDCFAERRADEGAQDADPANTAHSAKHVAGPGVPDEGQERVSRDRRAPVPMARCGWAMPTTYSRSGVARIEPPRPMRPSVKRPPSRTGWREAHSSAVTSASRGLADDRSTSRRPASPIRRTFHLINKTK